jgi:hypothetical protein
MHVDEYGLPQQADGDRNDQLQRVGMLVASRVLSDPEEMYRSHTFLRWVRALRENLQPAAGVYSRYTGAPTNNVSADQLIGALCAWVAMRGAKQVLWMTARCLSRFGFAQNFKDGLNDDVRTKIPDFMLLRALPLFLRCSVLAYPALLLVDALLVLQAISAIGPRWKDGGGFARRGPDDVDHVNTILTLVTCLERSPSPLSKLAWFLFKRLCPWNYGCVAQKTDSTGLVYFDNNAHHPTIGSLRWYFRAGAGGNPEVGEALIAVVRKHL